MAKNLNPKILCFLSILLLFFQGCHNDDFYEKNVIEKPKVVIKRLNQQELKKHPKVYNRIEKIDPNQVNHSAKIVSVNGLGFSIDTEEVLYVENNELETHTYTFKIYRNENSDLTENLVLKYNQNTLDYDAYLVQYNFSVEDIAIYRNGGTVPNIDEKTNILFLPDLDSSEFMDAKTNPQPLDPLPEGCRWVLIGQDYTSDGVRWELIKYYIIDCSGSSGGGGGGNSEGGDDGGSSPSNGNNWGNDSGNGANTGGGGGSSNNTGNTDGNLGQGDGKPLLITPVIPIDHIKELVKISNQNSNVRFYINDFKDNLNLYFETGVEFNSNNSPFPAQNNIFNGVRFFPVNANDPQIRLHKHHNQLHPVFSAEDVLGMADFFVDKKAIDPTGAVDITFMMVSKTGLHAFRVTDPEKAQEFYDLMNYLNNKKIFIFNYDKVVIEKTIRECNCTEGTEFDDLLFTNFVMFLISDVNGFGYYFAPHPADANGDYQWTKQN